MCLENSLKRLLGVSMAYNEMYIKVVQDTRREIESWFFSPNPITETNHLLDAHYDVLDMFLCQQPLIVVDKCSGLSGKGVAKVSQKAAIISPEQLTPPYELILVNTYALNLLEGKTITEQFANLVDFYVGIEQRHFLVDMLKEMQSERLYLISVC